MCRCLVDSSQCFSYCVCEGFPHSGSEFACIFAADFQGSVDYNFVR